MLGDVYFARDILSGEDLVVKFEPMEASHPTLKHEFQVYGKVAGATGIPCVRWFGTETGYYALVLERLGPSLDDVFTRCAFRFSLTTVLLLANQLVSLFNLL
jgi:hypothetical protein